MTTRTHFPGASGLDRLHKALKENRPLAEQLASAFDSAWETLKAGLGENGCVDALSGLPDLLSSAPAAAAPVVNQNNNQTVPAPVSISLTAAGTDPETVGKSIYDVAERYLLRTLQAL